MASKPKRPVAYTDGLVLCGATPIGDEAPVKLGIERTSFKYITCHPPELSYSFVFYRARPGFGKWVTTKDDGLWEFRTTANGIVLAQIQASAKFLASGDVEVSYALHLIGQRVVRNSENTSRVFPSLAEAQEAFYTYACPDKKDSPYPLRYCASANAVGVRLFAQLCLGSFYVQSDDFVFRRYSTTLCGFEVGNWAVSMYDLVHTPDSYRDFEIVAGKIYTSESTLKPFTIWITSLDMLKAIAEDDRFANLNISLTECELRTWSNNGARPSR